MNNNKKTNVGASNCEKRKTKDSNMAFSVYLVKAINSISTPLNAGDMIGTHR